MTMSNTVTDFYMGDYRKTLFPMATNRFLIEVGQAEINDFLGKCLSSKHEAYSFRSQTRVYAGKPRNHLRRTVKLDPVAEFFIYDLVFRNRSHFRPPYNKKRKHFGYRFKKGNPLNPSNSYKKYKRAISVYRKKYKFSISFDIAAYFNSIYHHDLASWFSRLEVSSDDYNSFGQFLREINSGRSVDCLPQGLYPTKMIGSDFLRFVEQFHGIKSKAMVRFMDDFVLFANSRIVLRRDFFTIQQLLGDKGLSLNPNKTSDGIRENIDVTSEIKEVRKRLLQRRRIMVMSYDSIMDDEIEIKKDLSNEEMRFLRDLLAKDDVAEEDAELVLALMAKHAAEVIDRLGDISKRFPHLIKNVYCFCLSIDDVESLARFVVDFLDRKDAAIYEFQLFWIACILEDKLLDSRRSAEIIDKLYNHVNATPISRAKILEIPDLRYGLVELRDKHLGAGQSDWLAWASAVGHRRLKKVDRFHRLRYFSKASNYNKLVFDILSKS